ncbi:MAG: hypothetical protein ABSC08_13775 [Bryobacteraceae bacterium]|jgi:hypothetical protein
MSYVYTTEKLNPIEEMQVRFAAELFGWMREPVVQEQGRRQMARFLEELALPVQELPDPANTPEAALRLICESDAEVRQRLGRALRHVPLYLELSARALPYFATPGRYRHAAWLYLTPEAARRLAARHLGAMHCRAAAAEEFLQTLELKAADQAAVTEAGETHAA